MKTAVVLAGGLGTRLSHVVSDTQKVMAPVGGRPFLSYVLDDLINKGIGHFVLAVSYKCEQIYDFFGTRYKGAEIVYSHESTPLGTGGAIKQAVMLAADDTVLIVNGDTYFDVDINKMLDFHRSSGADITLAAKSMENFSRYGAIEIADDAKILRFSEKKHRDKGLINGGVYILNKSAVTDVPLSFFSFEKDILEKESSAVYAYSCDGFFIDIGIPEDYFSAQLSVPLAFGMRVFKAAFLDRDGVICKEKHHLYKTEDFEFIDGVPQAIEKLREKGFLIIVITNQAGVAKGLYTEADVNKLHEYMLSLLEGQSHIDGIYYCPFHEQALIEKYRLSSPDRKPSPGMINRAVADFARKGIHIDLSASIIVGDTERDIQTGINTGIGTKVLVRSGHKIDEGNTKADITADSLTAFVNSYFSL